MDLDSWLEPRTLARTRRERAELVDELRRVAADADAALFDLLKRTVDALEICEHQLSCVLPPDPSQKTLRRIADVRQQIRQRMRRQPDGK